MTQISLTKLLENGDGILQSVIMPYLIPSSMFSIAIYDVNYINNIESILNLRTTSKNVLNAIQDDRCTIHVKELIDKSPKSFSLEEKLEIQDYQLTLLKTINLYKKKRTILNINSRIDILSKFWIKGGWMESSIQPYDIPTWYDSIVVGLTTTKIKVRYIAWGKNFDTWINIEEFKTRIAEHGTNIYMVGKKLMIGDRIDCLIPGGIWREAKVIDISDDSPVSQMATIKCDVRRGGQPDPITENTYLRYDIIKVPLTHYNDGRFTSHPSSYRIKPFGTKSRWEVGHFNYTHKSY